MNKKFILGILALIIVLALSIAIFNITKPSSTGNAVKSTAPVKEFSINSYTEIIDGKYYPKFSPNNLEVNKGDMVRIKITNTKGTHDFKIDEFNVYTETPLNEEVIIEFIADKAGSFEYYCSKTGHRQAGHWGTLNVLK